MIIISFILSLTFGVAAFYCLHFKVFIFFIDSNISFWLTLGMFFFSAFLVSFNKLVRFLGHWIEKG